MTKSRMVAGSRRLGKGLGRLLVAFCAFAVTQSAQAAVVDLGGNPQTISDLSSAKYNGVDFKGNTVVNGTLTVTGEQIFSDNAYTFGSGLILNQTSGRWSVSGNRQVYVVDGGIVNLNDTGTAAHYFGRRYSGGKWYSYSSPTELVLDNGTFNCASHLYFSPIVDNTNGREVQLVLSMNNNSSLSVTNGKELKFGAVERAKNNTHKYEKVTVAVTNSTISAGKIHFGSNNDYLTNQGDSYINVSFGPGADITCRQLYVYKYPRSTIVFDGATVRTTSSNLDTNFFGLNADAATAKAFDGYQIGSGGLTFDVTVNFEHGSLVAPLFGPGGFTKTGSGTLTYNRDVFLFTGPLTVSNGTFISSQKMAASAFRVDGASSVLNLSNASLTNATVALSATAGGTLTLAGATIADASPDLTLAGGGTTDYFTRDGVVGAYALDSLTLGAGAVLDLDANATAIDAVNAATTNITATTAEKATINLKFSALPSPGRTFTLFETDSADKFTVVPKLGSLTLPNEVSVVDGKLALTITADDYTWNGSGTNWGDAGAWTLGGNSATWADGNNAIFSTANAAATLAANASAAEVRFTADATVGGSATLTASSVSVDQDVSATISAPTDGAMTKTGEGTLTLAQNRTAQTTLTEGTLVMSGATVDPTKLTLGTDATKSVTFDYGAQTLSGKWTDYLTAGIDVTLTNGTFSTAQNPGWWHSTMPKTLTIAKGATMTTSERFTWNVSGDGSDVTNYVNIAGSSLVSTKANNNWIVQNSRSGTLAFNVTDGGLLEFAYKTFFLACRDDTTENDTPSVLMTFNDSAFRVNNNHLFLGSDDSENDRKNPKAPVFELAMTNSTLDVGTGIVYLGFDKVRSNHGGHATADFENCVITAREFKVNYDRPANAARFNNTTIAFTTGSTGWAFEAQKDWAASPGEEWVGTTPIRVGPLGLTLDTQSNTGCGVRADIAGGPVTKKGSGKLTIYLSQTSSAADFICEEGETILDAGLTMNRPVAVKDGAKLSAKATAQSTLEGLTLEANSTLNIDSYTSGVVPISVSTLTLPESGTAALTLNGGAFSVGTYKILEKSGIAVADVDGKLVPSTGSETYGYSVSGDMLVLTVGTPVHGRWRASAGSGSFSEPGNWEDGQVPVAGDYLDFSGVTSEITITCGDMSGTVFAGAVFGSNKKPVTIDGTLRLAALAVSYDSGNFSVAEGSKLIVDGDVTLSTATSQFLFIVHKNYGEVEIGGKVIVTGKAKGYPCYDCSADATISVSGIDAREGNDYMKLNAQKKEAPTVKWIIGEGGLGGSKGYWIDRGDGNNKKGTGAELKASADFTIADPIGARQILTLDTGDGKTITVNGEIYMDPISGTVNTLTVKGSGTVNVCNTVNRGSGSGAFNGAVIVANTATLAVNAGKQVTTGEITVSSGATLQVAESAASAGTAAVTLGGGLTLVNNAYLGFNYTNRNAPMLDLTGRTVAFDEGAATNVVVKISADRGVFPRSGEHVLTSGFDFTGVGVEFADGTPAWANDISVSREGGNIVINVKPRGFGVFVR